MSARAASDARSSRKALLGASIGTLVEWFDFGVYASVASIIAVQFFPAGDPVASLLNTFAVFAVAFFMRPVGAFVLGHFGDRLGRKNTLAFSVITMACATFLIGALPSYASIGVLAPVLLLVCRMAQGFAAGGEYMGGVSFAAEHAPPGRQGRYVAVVAANIVGGFLVANLVVLGATALIGDAAMQDWGWRVAFLIALPIGAIGLYVRLRLEETPEFRALLTRSGVVRAPIAEALRTQRRPMLLLFGAAIPYAVTTYLFLAYAPTFLTNAGGNSSWTALTSNIIVVAMVVVLAPLVGDLIDRFGPRPLMVAGSIGYLLLSVPAFMVMRAGGLVMAVLGQLLLAGPFVLFGSAVLVAAMRAFPTEVRYTASGICYNAVLAIFGGTAPYVATFLTDWTGNPLSPGWYVAALAVIAIPLLLGPVRSLARTTPGAASEKPATERP